MKLIDLETAIHTACNAVEHYPSEWQEIEDEMRKLPVIEARKHGHWVVTENTYQCQFCQYWDTRKKEQVNGRYVFSKLPNYCPDCGAVMDEEPKND